MKLLKKGSLLRTSWVELYTIIVGLIGLILALSIQSGLFSYLVVIATGFVCGRLLYSHRRWHKFPVYLIVFGFFLGYIIGSYYTSRKLLLFVAVLSTILSYYLHKQKSI